MSYPVPLPYIEGPALIAQAPVSHFGGRRLVTVEIVELQQDPESGRWRAWVRALPVHGIEIEPFVHNTPDGFEWRSTAVLDGRVLQDVARVAGGEIVEWYGRPFAKAANLVPPMMAGMGV
jgi:hypothetical protein